MRLPMIRVCTACVDSGAGASTSRLYAMLAAVGAGSGPPRRLDAALGRSPSARLLTTPASRRACASTPPLPPGPPTPGIVATLRSRGLLQDSSDAARLEAAAAARPLRVYCGVDPTADSLHLGNLVSVMVLAWFQRHGHQPVLLLGGATGRVGDPSGKSVERPLLAAARVDANAARLRELLGRLLGGGRGETRTGGDEDAGTIGDEDEPTGRGQNSPTSAPQPALARSPPLPQPVFCNNLDWWSDLSFLEVLRAVGRHLPVSPMLQRESVRSRLGAGLSYAEFSYQLLQGYDFVHLHRTLGVSVQVGGGDQWGNIACGLDLVRRMSGGDGKEEDLGEGKGGAVHGLTTPLLVRADGTKYGKSEGGAVWLSADRLSPYGLYQRLLAVPDVDVGGLLLKLTLAPVDDCRELARRALAGEGPPNAAQRRLAGEVVRAVHGEAALSLALAATRVLAPGSAQAAPAAWELRAVAACGAVPVVPVSQGGLSAVSVAQALHRGGASESRAAARRLVEGGGVRVNGARADRAEAALEEGQVLWEGDARGYILLAAGKKNRVLVEVIADRSGA